MLRFLSIATIFNLNCFLTVAAMADSIRQQAAYFENDDGLQRQRLRLDSNIAIERQLGIAAITASSVNVGLERDLYRDLEAADDKFGKQYYEGGRRIRNGWNLGWNNTIAKLTDFRIFSSSQDDKVASSRSFALGASQWIWHESIQLNLDVSRTLVDRPELLLLDGDSESITLPAFANSTGWSMMLRHLASPTTITNYGATFIVSNDRPLRQDYLVGLKQYLKSQKGAVHAEVVRSLNRGKLKATTMDGQLSAWIIEVAYLQSFGDAVTGRLSWRQYREDEVTRDSHQDELVRGTDLWSISFVNDLKKLNLTEAPVSIDLSHSRYRTNEMIVAGKGKRINAATYELGATAKF